jgi:hypothetical protein
MLNYREGHTEELPMNPDLEMPADFPSEAFRAAYWIVNESKPKLKEDTYWQFSAAWRGLQYRFLSCTQHDAAFTQSVCQHSISPLSPERWRQEHELFAFFFTGLSAIENLCFGVYAGASLLDPVNLPMNTARDLRDISPISTAQKLSSCFSGDNLSVALQQAIDSPQFKEWKITRDSLSHRGNPGRVFALGTRTSTAEEAIWLKGIALNETTTNIRRAWLCSAMKEILVAFESFLRPRF